MMNSISTKNEKSKNEWDQLPRVTQQGSSTHCSAPGSFPCAPLPVTWAHASMEKAMTNADILQEELTKAPTSMEKLSVHQSNQVHMAHREGRIGPILPNWGSHPCHPTVTHWKHPAQAKHLLHRSPKGKERELQHKALCCAHPPQASLIPSKELHPLNVCQNHLPLLQQEASARYEWVSGNHSFHLALISTLPECW